MAACSLITATGAFNRAVIMTAIHADARRRIARAAAIGCTKPMRYAVAFREACADVWATARIHRDHFARDACYAAAGAIEVRIMDLEAERFSASMIDSTVAMLAAVSSVDAQLATLRRAA